MDRDIAAKKKKREPSLTPQKSKPFTESRFFGAGTSTSTPRRHANPMVPVAGPSRSRGVEDKENVPLFDEELDFIMDDPDDPVTQEDGYISPSPFFSRPNTPGPDLSSPLRPGAPQKRRIDNTDNSVDDFDADAISSPIATRQTSHHPSQTLQRLQWPQAEVLVQDTPGAVDDAKAGPDLRDTFSDDPTSEIDCFEEEDSLDPTPPATPDDSRELEVALGEDIDLEVDDLETQDIVTRTEIVANGWWEKWGRTDKAKGGRHQVSAHSSFIDVGTDTTLVAEGSTSPTRNQRHTSWPPHRNPTQYVTSKLQVKTTAIGCIIEGEEESGVLAGSIPGRCIVKTFGS